MRHKTVGFIGGGRITRIMLGGYKKAGNMPEQVIVSDTNAETLNNLKTLFPEISIAPNDNAQPALSDIVFVALHPPVMKDALSVLPPLKQTATLISLVPKLPITKISELLGGFQRIVRMIPNAPSIVNSGYNPMAFSPVFTPEEKAEISEMLKIVGECPEVSEDTLEAYAILAAMGPTYLWFQLYELQTLGKSFGLTGQAVEHGINHMVRGAVATMRESGLSPEAVMDLIPVKPLGDEEENIKHIYRSKLTTLYQKLRG
jgi:pyrroline-5-carboxylate reductase